MGASTSIGSSAGVGSDCSSSSITIGALDEPGSGGGAGARSVIRSLRGLEMEVRIRADSCFKSRWTKLGDGVWVVWGCEIVLDTSGISEVCAWVNTVRVGVRAGAAAVTVGVEVSADGILGILAIVADAGDAVAVARAVFVDGEGTAPGDASVVEPTTEASLVAALSFFSRATCKSNCKKSSPADCRLRGGFNSFWPADVGRRDTDVGVCIGV